MSLPLHYWMGDVHHCSWPPVSEMTYTVSSGTLNSTIPYHSWADMARCGLSVLTVPLNTNQHTCRDVDRWWQEMLEIARQRMELGDFTEWCRLWAESEKHKFSPRVWPVDLTSYKVLDGVDKLFSLDSCWEKEEDEFFYGRSLRCNRKVYFIVLYWHNRWWAQKLCISWMCLCVSGYSCLMRTLLAIVIK